jgi:hypothetical protein
MTRCGQNKKRDSCCDIESRCDERANVDTPSQGPFYVEYLQVIDEKRKFGEKGNQRNYVDQKV